MSPYSASLDKHRRLWRFMSVAGVVIIGFGICLVTEVALWKHEGVPVLNWVIGGTFALCVFISGVSIFGGAVVHRALYEMKKEQERGKRKD